jgi:excisionase family DNA binding protein
MEKLLTTKELAEAIGASESSLRRWTNSGAIRTSRTVGGHRRIPLSEAVRFIRETRATVVRPQVLGLPDTGTAHATGGDVAAALYQALLDGDAARARGQVIAMYLGGTPLAAIFDGPLAGAMHRVGELWRHDPRGVLVEHRATDICLQTVAELRQLLPAAEDAAPAAVGGAPADDPYLLPSMMAAAVLADAGYRVTSLGADTPAEVLAAAAEEVDARVVWLSVSHAEPEALRRDVERLASRLEPRGTTILIGGRGASGLSLPRLPNVRVLATMSQLADHARGAGATAPRRGHAVRGK